MPLPLEALEDFAARVLRQTGVPETEARLTAATLVLADSWGVFTHGLKNLAGYVRRLEGGGIRALGQPRITAQGPAWAFVDGDQALGMVAAGFAMRTAIACARRTGLGYVALSNTCHFGAAGCYSVLAAHEGMIGFAMSNDTPTVTAPGARGPMLGSNPFSFAAPVAGADPLLLDMATSTVAGGKVFTAAAHGQSIPLGWVVDAAGRPTTDPTVWPQAGTLTPMAGHKGYGLALMIEVLSAVVPGGPLAAQVLSYSFADPSLPTGHGAAFLAVDVRAMPGGDQFPQRLSGFLDTLRAQPKAEGSDRILVPGEREWDHRRIALAHGLELPADVRRPLEQLATRLSLPSPFPHP